MSEPKKKGGARPNAGRKKSEAKVQIEAAIAASGGQLDGRSLGGKEHAGFLLDQLNAIDPQLIHDIAIPISLEPIKVPKEATDEEAKALEKLEAQRKLDLVTKKVALKQWRKLSFEVQGWARLWFAASTALDTRRYLYDKAGHQAVKIINHVHDKPIEHNVTLSLGEGMRLAMQEADQRLKEFRGSYRQ